MSSNAEKVEALQQLIRAVGTPRLRPIARRPVSRSPRIRCWLDAFDTLPPCSAAGRRLLEVSRTFALTPWAQAAIYAGWSDGDLFNLYEGLVPLALVRGAEIVAITCDMAELRTGRAGGSFPRPAKGVWPWWSDPRAIGEI